MFEMINTLIMCGTGLFVVFLILLAMPKSQLRSFLAPLVGWAVAALSTIYIVSPIDIVPDFIPIAGWLDDGGALMTAIAGAVMAMKAQSEQKKISL